MFIQGLVQCNNFKIPFKEIYLEAILHLNYFKSPNINKDSCNILLKNCSTEKINNLSFLLCLKQESTQVILWCFFLSFFLSFSLSLSCFFFFFFFFFTSITRPPLSNRSIVFSQNSPCQVFTWFICFKVPWVQKVFFWKLICAYVCTYVCVYDIFNIYISKSNKDRNTRFCLVDYKSKFGSSILEFGSARFEKTIQIIFFKHMIIPF